MPRSAVVWGRLQRANSATSIALCPLNIVRERLRGLVGAEAAGQRLQGRGSRAGVAGQGSGPPLAHTFEPLLSHTAEPLLSKIAEPLLSRTAEPLLSHTSRC